ncbi:hypothetical protein QYE76_001941 [Lolium multiflorum]|uniref:Uncharacterized protein n=1 Tax=Lolium multiflorum TaxID=4521 RepID=A0AAD8RPQ3_LOLMU|nr:hypothetical protein QYE76_001941 [Lolium multiflorum]
MRACSPTDGRSPFPWPADVRPTPPATARRPLHRETLTASRVADLLDAGCSVGSPMRTIAAYSVSDDLAHIEVINGVEHDDAVRGLCRHDMIASIAEVDFEGVKELEFSLPPSLQWWPPLKMGCLSVTRWRRLHAAKESMGDI